MSTNKVCQSTKLFEPVVPFLDLSSASPSPSLDWINEVQFLQSCQRPIIMLTISEHCQTTKIPFISTKFNDIETSAEIAQYIYNQIIEQVGLKITFLEDMIDGVGYLKASFYSKDENGETLFKFLSFTVTIPSKDIFGLFDSSHKSMLLNAYCMVSKLINPITRQFIVKDDDYEKLAKREN